MKLYGPSVKGLVALMREFGYGLVYVGLFLAVFVDRSLFPETEDFPFVHVDDVFTLCHKFQRATPRLARQVPHISGEDMCSPLELVGYDWAEIKRRFHPIENLTKKRILDPTVKF